MADYPIVVDLAGRSCLVAGGGPVACRRVDGLLAAGARVVVVAPEVCDELRRRLEASTDLVWEPRRWRREDLAGAALCFACTDDAAVQEEIVHEARVAGVLVCRADRGRGGDFTVPALVRHGELTVAVSTSGRAPVLASWLRTRLERWLGSHYGEAIRRCDELRRELLARGVDGRERRRRVLAVLEAGLLEALADGDRERLDILHEQALAGTGLEAPHASPGDERGD